MDFHFQTFSFPIEEGVVGQDNDERGKEALKTGLACSVERPGREKRDRFDLEIEKAAMFSAKRGHKLGIALVTGLLLVVGVFFVGDIKSWCLNQIGTALFSGFGGDYGIELMNGFSLQRFNSLDHRIVGPNRQTSITSSTPFWVDPNILRMGHDKRYIICFQEASPMNKINTNGWWLVDTDKLTVNGPLTDNELKSLQVTLGIDDITVSDVPK